MPEGWTPYGDGTSGHQGTTSEAAEPDRRRRIDVALQAVRQAGRRGLTWRELAEREGWHHGQASSALSNLHRTGLAVRLSEARERCGVYVTPENIEDRPYRAHRSATRASAATTTGKEADA